MKQKKYIKKPQTIKAVQVQYIMDGTCVFPWVKGFIERGYLFVTDSGIELIDVFIEPGERDRGRPTDYLIYDGNHFYHGNDFRLRILSQEYFEQHYEEYEEVAEH